MKIDDPINQGEQAAAIFGALHAFLKARPGRRVILSRENGEFRVDIDEQRTCRSATLQDAASQAATVVTFDAAAEAPR
jgi:hypothetical protein